MDDSKFWEMVQVAHDQSGGDMNKKSEAIKASVAKRSSAEATEFSHFFDSMMDRAYSWPLWGAAYIINGGCGDDTFADFRASLISRGRQAFENAISDPESLCDESFNADAWFYEGYQYAVTDGVKAAVGSIPDREQPHPKEPSGTEWSEDNVHDLFPRLSKKFG